MCRRLLCYGDSNTYGYDPRSYLGGRYPESIRWTALLKERGWQVCNEGENGRSIPCGDRGIDMAVQSLCREEADILAVMLGIAPLPMVLGAWVQDEETIAASRCLARCYEDTARRLGIGFADAGSWGIGLTFDGVHFSEAGHLAFAEGIHRALSTFVSKDCGNQGLG